MRTSSFSRSIRTAAALPVVLCCAALAVAAPTAEQRQRLDSAKLAIRAADRLLQGGRGGEAVEYVKKAQADLAPLASAELDADTQNLLQPAMEQLQGLYILLELNGLQVPSMPMPEPAEMQTEQPALGDRPPQLAANGAISFSKQVAPLLVAKCGSCHIDDAKGKVRMTHYTALMAGSPDDGPIILPGKGNGSRMYEVIESGDMPRGGGKITQEELTLLTTWIDQGAKNDAPSPNTPLRQLAQAMRPEAPKVMLATGDESVSFGLHIAPVLVSQCMGCHGNEQPDGDFSLSTFQRLLRGGDSGPGIAPGKPAESLLVKKIKGMAGERMPLDRPALSDEIIAQIETWIREGAKFDGEAPGTPLPRVAAVAFANDATPEELTEHRVKLSQQNWRLAIPDAEANRHETKNFLMLGNVGEATLAEVGDLAEAGVAALAGVISDAAGQPLTKGRVTIYVFANRYDYAELGTMIERRQLPRTWNGHWRYDIVDPYIAISYAHDQLDSLDALLAHQVISMYVAGQGAGASPRWFAEGAGRALAAQVAARDPLVEQWDEQLPSVLAKMSKPDDFMTGRLGPEDADLASYNFAQFLLTSSSRFNTLLESLREGADFDAALPQAYGAPAAALAMSWAKWVVRQ